MVRSINVFQAIIFDLDGTLIDNSDQIFESYKSAIFSLDLPYPGDDKLGKFIGMSMQQMISNLKIPKEKSHAFKEKYAREVSQRPSKLFPGIKTLLESLVGKIPMAIVTSKLLETTKAVMDELELHEYFPVVLTAADVKKAKPDPEGLNLACEQLGLTPNPEVLYVGDRIHDLEAANNAKISGIAVSWGVDGARIPEKQLVHTVADLMSYLNTE